MRARNTTRQRFSRLGHHPEVVAAMDAAAPRSGGFHVPVDAGPEILRRDAIARDVAEDVAWPDDGDQVAQAWDEQPPGARQVFRDFADFAAEVEAAERIER